MLENVKKNAYETLIILGYTEDQARETVETFTEITGYFHGRPSRVMTDNGTEIYL